MGTWRHTQSAGIWDTNLEEVWHVVSVGWYETYPEYMGTEDENGEIISSNLTRALDAAGAAIMNRFLNNILMMRGILTTTILVIIIVRRMNIFIGS